VSHATFALSIPHTPWIPERVASFDRLQRLLANRPQYYREFTEREPNWSWAQKLWTWGLETGASHLVQLQDDVIVDSEFWPNLRAMVEAVPDQIIGLESVHPISRSIYEAGGCWYTTNDGLIGVGYVMPHDALIEFEAWRSNRLRPGAAQAMSEDTLIDVFCMSTGRKVWHPVPTIIDHDTEIASTYGNDKHTNRRPLVTTVRGAGWEQCLVGRLDGLPHCNHYKVKENVPNLGRFYVMTPGLCRRWVKGFHMVDLERCRQ
jgi:hypothetical protein